MPGYVNEGGVWKEFVPHVNEGGTWKAAQSGWVNEGGIWKQWHALSQPVLTVVEFGSTSAWVQTYRASGSPSGGSNRDRLMYAGAGGWNSEAEEGLGSVIDMPAVAAAMAAKPTFISGTAYVWSGYKRSSNAGNLYFGWSPGPAGTVAPGFIPFRSHDETDPNWTTVIPWTRPGASGESNSAAITPAAGANIVNALGLNSIQSCWLSNDNEGDDNWGWFAGSAYTNSNSGGTSGSLVDIAPGDTHVARMEIMHE